MTILPCPEMHSFDRPIQIRPFGEEHLDIILQGMSLPAVSRWLLIHVPPTRDAELEWLKKVGDHKRTDEHYGGIYVESQLIGTTAIHAGSHIKDRHAVHSGKVIFNPAFWGKGISTAVTMARTLLIFHLNYQVANSSAFISNVGSWASLGKAGYWVSGLGRFNLLDVLNGRLTTRLELQALPPTHLGDKGVATLTAEVLDLLAAEASANLQCSAAELARVRSRLEDLARMPSQVEMADKLQAISSFVKFD